MNDSMENIGCTSCTLPDSTQSTSDVLSINIKVIGVKLSFYFSIRMAYA